VSKLNNSALLSVIIADVDDVLMPTNYALALVIHSKSVLHNICMCCVKCGFVSQAKFTVANYRLVRCQLHLQNVAPYIVDSVLFYLC
jgi:hypothetical protein